MPRSLIGTIVFIIGISLYAMLVMNLALYLPQGGVLGWTVQVVYHVVFGLIWLWPATRLVRWAARGGRVGF
ncbi:MAG: DUF2842 domain-containing protein [Geminicoccaceae bacterium]